MNERKVEDLTEHLHNLIITNRQEEAIIIQQIQDLKQRIKKNNKSSDDDIVIGTRVTYATNGVFKKTNIGIITRFTHHRIVINTTNGNQIYRSRHNIRQIQHQYERK